MLPQAFSASNRIGGIMIIREEVNNKNPSSLGVGWDLLDFFSFPFVHVHDVLFNKAALASLLALMRMLLCMFPRLAAY